MKNFVQVAKYFGHLFRRALLHYPKLFYTISTIIYLIIYMSFLNWITYDMLGYMRGYQAIVSHGISAFRETNFDYSPASMYWFSLSTLLPYPSYINIKLIALPFIPLSGFIISRIILMFTHNRVSAWLGYTFSIITPTIIINSALWGQMDVYYSFFSLLCVFFLLQKKPSVALIAWGLSFALKAPALFLAPFLLLMLLKKQIPWKSIWIPPAIYLSCSLPLILIGVPLERTLGIYATQAGGFHSLCMNCATIWSYFPDTNYLNGVILGIGITVYGSFLYLLYGYKKLDITDNRKVLVAAVLSTLFMPFLLPKMHDRYFYLAEMLSLAFLLIDWKYLLIPILLEISSGIAYWHYFFSDATYFSESLAASFILAAIGLCIWLIKFSFIKSNSE